MAHRRTGFDRIAGVLAMTMLAASCATPAPARVEAGALPATLSPITRQLAEMELDIPYTKYVLDNGLTLLVHEDKTTPTVTFHLWYHVGSKNEPQGRSGFAHLFEHLMFNGSENFNDDFFRATQKIGATNQNGTTSTDRTNYFQTVPKEALDSILWLESDRMGHLLGAVDQAKLDEQRGVVQNEKRQSENQPYGTVFNRIVAATYPPHHPYGHTVIGSMEDLEAATLDDVGEWFRTWYGPANAVLVLAGDITPEEAKARVEKYFGEIPPGPPPAQPKSWVPKLAEDQREVMYDRVAAPRIYRTWNVPQVGHHDGELLDVAAYALGGDRNARLTKRLVYEEQIATSVGVGNSQSELAGQFRIVVTAKPGVDLALIEKAMDEELAKLLAEGPTAAELEKIQVQNISGIVSQLERASSKASMLAMWETYLGNADGWKDSVARIETATSAAVIDAGRRWLTKEMYTLTVLPFGDYAATGAKVDRSKMPEPDTVAAAKFPEYKTSTLSNGVKVMLVERPSVPKVLLQVVFETGYGADFAQTTPGVGSLSVNLMDEGTPTRSALQIADELDRLGASLFVGGGGDTSTLSLETLKPTLDEAMEVFVDVMRNPSFNEADFVRVRDQQVQGLRQAQRDPSSIAGRVLARSLWGADHPYGRLTTPDGVASITREQAADFYRHWFGPNNVKVVVVVGDTTLEEITPYLETAFRGWADAPGRPAAVSQPARPAAPKVYLMDRPGAVQSVILVGSTLAPRVPAEDTQLSAFNALFGGNFISRVNLNLREDKGWSYGARSGISGGRGPRLFQISAPVQADKTRGALIELRKELTDIVGTRPPTPDELNDVRNNTILGLASRWETSSTIAGALGEMALFNLPGDYWDAYATTYRTVTPAQVDAVAKRLVPDQNHVWVVVGDRAKIEQDVRGLNIGEVVIVNADGEPVGG